MVAFTKEFFNCKLWYKFIEETLLHFHLDLISWFVYIRQTCTGLISKTFYEEI